MSLKDNKNRWNDGLSNIQWEEFEKLLADYYAQKGFRVEHVGTGGTTAKYDGGIDLKLYKDDKYTIVQCKHWNVKQVPHNDVHQLIGLMATEKADAAIFVTSGEYTRAALNVGEKYKQIELVDGTTLRKRLGNGIDSIAEVRMSNSIPWREEVAHKTAVASDSSQSWSYGNNSKTDSSANKWNRKRKRRPKSLLEIIVTVALPLLFLFFIIKMIPIFVSNLIPQRSNVALPLKQESKPVLKMQKIQSQKPQISEIGASDEVMTSAELKEWERKNKESMDILERTTPEL